jgi:hypothetical protein
MSSLTQVRVRGVKPAEGRLRSFTRLKWTAIAPLLLMLVRTDFGAFSPVAQLSLNVRFAVHRSP